MTTEQRLAKINRVTSLRQEGIVVLEDVHDPHNAQAVLRCCDAFGFQKICFIFEKQPAFNPKKVGKSTSSSANKWLDIEKIKSTAACLEKLKNQGYELIAAALTPESEELFSAKITNSKIALLIGNEHTGLSATALKLADRKVMIPMQGMVQSLNLSVTAGIFLAEITRQRKLAGMEKYLLSAEDQGLLKESFMAKSGR